VTELLDTPWQDPLSAPYWAAAEEHRLLVQRCTACSRHQHYPRPFCIRCTGEVTWVEASGVGTVYSVTRNHLEVTPELSPPYLVGLVELEEGPRLVTNFLDECRIGDRVEVAWRDRPEGPPVPVFRLAKD